MSTPFDKDGERSRISQLTSVALDSFQIYSVGLVSSEWGYAESIFQLMMWHLARVDMNIGRCITTHLTDHVRQQMARALANEVLSHNIPLRDEVLKLISDFNALRDDRNDIVHAQWMGNPKEKPKHPVAFRVKARGELKTSVQPFEESQIKAVAEKITRLTIRLAEVLEKLPPIPKAENRLLAEQVRLRTPAQDPTAKEAAPPPSEGKP